MTKTNDKLRTVRHQLATLDARQLALAVGGSYMRKSGELQGADFK